jgi:hypothetical protein
LAAHQRQSALAEKAEQARVLANEFLRIINLHRVEFVPAVGPVVPAPTQPDRAAIYKHYERQALSGLSVFNRRGRKDAKHRANAWAEAEVRRQWVEASQNQAQAQAYFDERWRQLCDNAPNVVIETLEEAFEDNEVPSAAVGVDGNEVALVVLVPGADSAVPERMPTTTDAGNLSLKKLTQRDREDYYKLYVCGQVLVTLRETFAVAPGLRSARVAVLRTDDPDAYGRPKISCILAARLDRPGLDGVQWAAADAAQIVNDASTDLVHNARGRSHALSPIDLAGEPELTQLIHAVNLVERTAADVEDMRSTPSSHGQPPGAREGTVATIGGGQAGRPNPPTRPGRPNRTLAKALLLGVGLPVVLCGGVGAVMATIGDNASNVPATTPTSSTTTTLAPSTTALASTLPAATSSPIPTAPATRPPAPPPVTIDPPPAPPPPPEPPPNTPTPPRPGAVAAHQQVELETAK